MAAQRLASTDEADAIADALVSSAVGGPPDSRRRGRFFPLAVQEVRPLTADAVEVTFGVPAELQEQFEFLPGQYVALRATIDGHEVRRSYSLCRPPTPGAISVGIKRDFGGRFSSWAQTELDPGDTLEVMSPQGSFTSSVDQFDGVHVAGIAAGSGITPLMALATSVLGHSATSRFTLVYTNRSTASIMFLDELSDLKDRYPTRFVVHHVLSREQRPSSLLSGRIDEEKLGGILDRLLLPTTVDEWFLCGPLELVQMCRSALEGHGVENSRVRYELFTTGEPGSQPRDKRPVRVRSDEPTYEISFTLDGQLVKVDSPVSAAESILDAALRVRPDAPYACAGGVCGTCRARVLEGSVNMTENYALEPDELERGYVLTCQSHPTTSRVRVDYDV
jgi:ring-1,2-phenylacetyl-CoA epoxidase subunit PaaE